LNRGITTVKVSDVTDVKKIAKKLMKKMFKSKVKDITVGSSRLSGYRWTAYVKATFADGSAGLWKMVISATNGKVILFEPAHQRVQRTSRPAKRSRTTESK
jgi:hypothetical protein